MKLYLIDNKTAPKSQRYRWQLVGRNGKIVAASSEGFSCPEECEQNVILTIQGLDKHARLEGYVPNYTVCITFASRRRPRKLKP